MIRPNYECRCKQRVRTLKATWWVFGKDLAQFLCFFTSESLKGISSVLHRQPRWLVTAFEIIANAVSPSNYVPELACLFALFILFTSIPSSSIFTFPFLLPRRCPTSFQKALKGSIGRGDVESKAVRSTLILSWHIFGHCLVGTVLLFVVLLCL